MSRTGKTEHIKTFLERLASYNTLSMRRRDDSQFVTQLLHRVTGEKKNNSGHLILLVPDLDQLLMSSDNMFLSFN